jgi:hypothetical protein
MDNQSQDTSPIASVLLKDEPDFIDLVERFANKLPTLISNLRESFDTNNWETMKKQAHDLKSTGGGHGFPQVTDVAVKIEAGILGQQYDGIPDLMNELDLLSKRIKAGLHGTN